MPQQFTDLQHVKLQQIADFDHVFVVVDGGYVGEVDRENDRFGTSLSAPEAIEPWPYATTLDGWELPLSGLTGQYGYDGPWLHNSEQIPGGVAERVLAMPGYWVAIYASYYCQECGGAGQIWNEDMTEELDCPAKCEPGTEPEGWTLAHKPFRTP